MKNPNGPSIEEKEMAAEALLDADERWQKERVAKAFNDLPQPGDKLTIMFGEEVFRWTISRKLVTYREWDWIVLQLLLKLTKEEFYLKYLRELSELVKDKSLTQHTFKYHTATWQLKAQAYFKMKESK